MTPAELAALPAWPAERLLTVPGRVRGVVLRDWAKNVGARFGPGAVSTVRARLGGTSPALPDAPDPEGWVPVHVLLGVGDALVHDLAHGDPEPLVALLHDAVAAQSPRAATWVARRLGPGPFFKKAPDGHPHLYDLGRVTGDHGRHQATFHCAGADFFAHPTWALLQLVALSALLRFLERTPSALAADVTAPDALRLTVAWR